MLRLIERSTDAAVSLDEMKQHLKREDTNEDDEFILACTKAATQYAETFTGLALVDQTWDQFIDAFPAGGPLYLRKWPLLEIVGVFARDSAEAEFFAFSIDFAGGSIYLPANGLWPTVDGASNAVRIRYRVGYVDTTGSPLEDTEIPEPIKAAIKIYAATIYGQREIDDPAALSVRIPFGAEALLRPYKLDQSLA